MIPIVEALLVRACSIFKSEELSKFVEKIEIQEIGKDLSLDFFGHLGENMLVVLGINSKVSAVVPAVIKECFYLELEIMIDHFASVEPYKETEKLCKVITIIEC